MPSVRPPFGDARARFAPLSSACFPTPPLSAPGMEQKDSGRRYSPRNGQCFPWRNRGGCAQRDETPPGSHDGVFRFSSASRGLADGPQARRPCARRARRGSRPPCGGFHGLFGKGFEPLVRVQGEEVLGRDAALKALDFLGKERNDLEKSARIPFIRSGGEVVKDLLRKGIFLLPVENNGGVLEVARSNADVTRVIVALDPFVEPVVREMLQRKE